MSYEVSALVEEANGCCRAAEWNDAIELLRSALTMDPDHARAHASLALALLGVRRIRGAAMEAQAALRLDGNDPFCHLAAATVFRDRDKLDDAWQHCLVALQADAVPADVYALAASIELRRGNFAATREHLDQVLALNRLHVGALTDLARLELAVGQLAEAATQIDIALTTDSENRATHTVAGTIALRRDDLEDAERHARFVLEKDASDPDALALWVAIKTRRNRALGLWWRFNTFISVRTDSSQIGLVIGSFVVARLAMIIAGALDLPRVESTLQYAWLVFCGYTWIAPTVFKRMLVHDLGPAITRQDL